jgi:hypothetical protein
LDPVVAVVVLCTLALVAVCAVIGSAVWRLAGLAPAPHLAPVLGLATLLVIVLPAVRLPGWAATGLVVILLATLVSLADRRALRGLRSGLADGVPVTLLALLALCLPFIVSGGFGILGMGDNDDWAMHMNGVSWLAHHQVPADDTIVGWGYPLGTHGLAAALSATGMSIPHAMTVEMATAPIVAVWAALGLLRTVPRPARWGLALLAGLFYLYASYYAEAAHKEVIAAPLVLGFALSLPAVVRAAGDRRAAARAAVVPAVLAAGAVQVLSWPGALWPIMTVGVWGALTFLGPGRQALLAARPRVTAALAGGGGAFAVMIAPSLRDIVAFQGSSFAHEPDKGKGNLEGPLPPHESLGVWFNGDFRFASHLPGLALVLTVGAGILVLLAVAHWWRRGPRVLAAAFAADWIVWAALTAFKNPYNAAKGLTMLTPMMGLALVAGAVVAWAPGAWRAGRRAPDREEAGEPLPEAMPAATYAVLGGVPGGAAALRRLAIAAVLVGAGASSFLALRDAIVGPDAHAAELRSLAATAEKDRTALLDPSDYGVWDVFSLRPYRPPLLYMVKRLDTRPEKHWHPGRALDLDSMTAATMNRLRWFITSNTPYASAPPPGVRLVRRTRSFALWERTGTVAPHSILPAEQNGPGAVLDCSTPEGRRISRMGGTARVRSTPVVGEWDGWHGDASNAGSTATRTLDLPPGRWDVSLQYVSRNPIDVTANGARATMPATLDRMSPFFYALTVRSGGGPVRISVHVHELNAIGRLLGSRGHTRALNSHTFQPLGRIAATRHGDRDRTVPLAKACGRYVDAYTPR